MVGREQPQPATTRMDLSQRKVASRLYLSPFSLPSSSQNVTQSCIWPPCSIRVKNGTTSRWPPPMPAFRTPSAGGPSMGNISGFDSPGLEHEEGRSHPLSPKLDHCDAVIASSRLRPRAP